MPCRIWDFPVARRCRRKAVCGVSSQRWTTGWDFVIPEEKFHSSFEMMFRGKGLTLSSVLSSWKMLLLPFSSGGIILLNAPIAKRMSVSICNCMCLPIYDHIFAFMCGFRRWLFMQAACKGETKDALQRLPIFAESVSDILSCDKVLVLF